MDTLPNVTVQTADVTAMPFEVGKFDAVTWHLMLHHAIHRVEALGEIARVLKPGGLSIGYNLTDTRLARLIRQVDGPHHRARRACRRTDCGKIHQGHHPALVPRPPHAVPCLQVC